MKKIFAIALALVMVLSMASAFAASSLPGTCDWGTWDCTTYTSRCGVAHAEVVKFVRTNDCDPFVESDCAAVVVDERVYFGVKVVFDANVNAQWLVDDATDLEVSISKANHNYAPSVLTDVDIEAALRAGTPAWGTLSPADLAKKVSGKTFWYTGSRLVEEFSKDYVFEAVATSTGVKVCANVEYLHNGLGDNLDLGKYTANVWITNTTTGDYAIKLVDKATKDEAVFYTEGGKLMLISVGNKDYNAYADNKFWGFDFTTGAEKWVADADTCMFLQSMMAFLKLNFLDCITADGIKAFFGWDDDDAFEACVTWSKNASSIVDAECVVAIPKTGDASVLAWLF